MIQLNEYCLSMTRRKNSVGFFTQSSWVLDTQIHSLSLNHNPGGDGVALLLMLTDKYKGLIVLKDITAI